MKRKLLISIIINIVLFIAVILLLLSRLGVFTKPSLPEPESSNPSSYVYEAVESTYETEINHAVVVFAGDSLTARCQWGELLDNDSILNRGIDGDTVEGLYDRIDEIISHDPAKLFVMIGSNDIDFGLDTDKSLEYYELILAEVSSKLPDCEIYIESLIPESRKSVEDNLVYIEYNSLLEEICEKYGCTYIDLFDDYLDADGVPDADLFADDGNHLNGAGYEVWIEKVRGLVEE